MTRRRLIWAIVAAVVFFTVGFFLSGEARAEAQTPGAEAPAATGHEVRAAVPVSGRAHAETSVPGPGSPTGDYGFLLIVGAVLVVLHWEAGRHIWRSLRNAKRVVDEAGGVLAKRNGPPKRAVEPEDQPPAGMPNGNTTTVDEHADEAIAVVNEEPPGAALRALLAWAAEQDGQLCEQLWAMDEAEEPEMR